MDSRYRAVHPIGVYGVDMIMGSPNLLALDGMRQMKTERFIESASIMGAPVNPMWDWS